VAGQPLSLPATDIASDLARDGYVKRTLSGDSDEDLSTLHTVLQALGKPLHVFNRLPFWKPLATDPDRPLGASGGVGLNGLHIDCVNVTRPPDIVCLYCIRSDPLGGGVNVVSRIDDLDEVLPPAVLSELRLPQFRDGTAEGLSGVGVDENPFAVLNATEGAWKWRYTDRLLRRSGRPSSVLFEINEILWHRVCTVTLERGDCLFVDQRTTLHGRLPLGQGQRHLPPEERRLLVQAYARISDSKC
jgi:hypothetical protein